MKNFTDEQLVKITSKAMKKRWKSLFGDICR